MANRDLLPEPYRQEASARRAQRGWLAGLVVCLLVSGGAVVAGALRSVPQGSDGVAEQVAVAERRADQSQAQAVALGEQLALHRRAANAVDAVAEQPDWRALIERVNIELGDEVVLTQYRLGPLEGGESSQVIDGDASGAVWLLLGGIAGDYAQVPALVLRLEATGLFMQVHLVETGRQNFAGESRIGFRLVCRLQ